MLNFPLKDFSKSYQVIGQGDIVNYNIYIISEPTILLLVINGNLKDNSFCLLGLYSPEQKMTKFTTMTNGM